MMRSVVATRYVTPLREGGSLPGLVEADDDGLYVVKFRGAGQGPRALVAEWLAGELARTIGLAVPDLVSVEVDPALGDAEPDEEIHDLVGASGGLNLGMDFLPGALSFNPAAATARDLIDAEFAADVVWLDALVTNPDRTAQSPNLRGSSTMAPRCTSITRGGSRMPMRGGRSSGSPTTCCCPMPDPSWRRTRAMPDGSTSPS